MGSRNTPLIPAETEVPQVPLNKGANDPTNIRRQPRPGACKPRCVCAGGEHGVGQIACRFASRCWKEVHRRNFKDLGDVNQHGCGDAVLANLIFLNLLPAQTDRSRQLDLSHAASSAHGSYAGAHIKVDGIGAISAHSSSKVEPPPFASIVRHGPAWRFSPRKADTGQGLAGSVGKARKSRRRLARQDREDRH